MIAISAVSIVFFDGKFDRVRGFVTLTASMYHSLLQKQITLATMECKHEDSFHVEMFWCLFNSAYQQCLQTKEKFNPTGWCTDMALSNFIGLQKIYGEDVTEHIKGCEFHFQQSVKRKSRILKETSKYFIELSFNLLTASTPEAYGGARDEMKAFLDNEAESKQLHRWFSWWDDRKHLIFRAFTGYSMPKCNQAEVIHAGWVNRDRMGVSLLDAALFDIRDSLLFKKEMEQFVTGTNITGSGPNQMEKLNRKRMDEKEAAAQDGQDLLQFGLRLPFHTSSTLPSTEDPSSTSSGPTTKTKSCRKMVVTRLRRPIEESSIIKVKKVTKVNKGKQR